MKVEFIRIKEFAGWAREEMWKKFCGCVRLGSRFGWYVRVGKWKNPVVMVLLWKQKVVISGRKLPFYSESGILSNRVDCIQFGIQWNLEY